MILGSSQVVDWRTFGPFRRHRRWDNWRRAEGDEEPRTCWAWMRLCHQLVRQRDGWGRQGSLCPPHCPVQQRLMALTDPPWPKASRLTRTRALTHTFTYKRHRARHGNLQSCWFRWTDDGGGGQIVRPLVSNTGLKMASPASERERKAFIWREKKVLEPVRGPSPPRLWEEPHIVKKRQDRARKRGLCKVWDCR